MLVVPMRQQTCKVVEVRLKPGESVDYKLKLPVPKLPSAKLKAAAELLFFAEANRALSTLCESHERFLRRLESACLSCRCGSLCGLNIFKAPPGRKSRPGQFALQARSQRHKCRCRCHDGFFERDRTSRADSAAASALRRRSERLSCTRIDHSAWTAKNCVEANSVRPKGYCQTGILPGGGRDWREAPTRNVLTRLLTDPDPGVIAILLRNPKVLGEGCVAYCERTTKPCCSLLSRSFRQ